MDLKITEKAVKKILNGEFSEEENAEMRFNDEYRPIYNGVIFEERYGNDPDEVGVMRISELRLTWKKWETVTIPGEELRGKSAKEIADYLNNFLKPQEDAVLSNDFYPDSLQEDYVEQFNNEELPF